MTISIDDYSEEGSVLDKIIAQERELLKARLAAAADNFNGCRLRVLVDDGGTTAFTAGMQAVENKDGSLTITFKQVSGPIGDMVGAALSFASTVDVTKLAYFDASKMVTDAQFSPKENLTSFADAKYMNFNGTKMAFDALFLFGTQGISGDDIQSISFNLYRTDGVALHVSELTEIGVRTMSIGDQLAREASDKDWETIDKGACFELKSDYVLGVTETDVIKRTASGDFLADLRLQDPAALYEIVSFTTEDGVVHKAGETVRINSIDGTANFAFTLNKDGSWSITDGDTAASLDAGRFVSSLITYEARKVTADAEAFATADVIIGVEGQNSAEFIKDASYEVNEGTSARFDLMSNLVGDRYNRSFLDSFKYASAQLLMADGTVKEMPMDLVSSFIRVDKAGGLNVSGYATDFLPAGSQLIVTVNYQTMDQFGMLSSNVGTAKVTINGLNDTPEAAAISATAAEGYATGNVYDWLAQATDRDMGAVLDFHSIAGYQIDRATLTALNTTKVIEAPPLVDQYLNLFKKVFNIFNSDGGGGDGIFIDPRIVEMARAYYTALVDDLTKIKEAMGDTRDLTLEQEMALFRKWTSQDYIASTKEFLSKLLLSGGEGDGGTGYEQIYFSIYKALSSFRLMDDRIETVYGSKVIPLEGGSLEIWGDGHYALSMAANADGIVSHDLKIGYTVQDELHAVSNEAFVSFFNNNTPEPAADFISAALGTTARVSLFANDSDINGDKLALAAVNDQAFVCKVQDTYDSTIIDPALTSDSRIAMDSVDYIKDDGTPGDAGCVNTFKIGSGLVMTVNDKGEGFIDTSGLAAIVNEAYRLSFWDQEVNYLRDPLVPSSGYYAENIWGNDQSMFASLLARYGVAYDAATGDITANFTYDIVDGYGGAARAAGYITLDVPDYAFTPAPKDADFIYLDTSFMTTDTVTEQQVYDKLNSDVWDT